MTAQPPAPPRPRGNAAARWLGGLLIAGGLLVAVTCGYVTADIAGACATEAPGSQVFVVIIGGIPTALGAITVIAGILVLLLSRPKTPPPGASG